MSAQTVTDLTTSVRQYYDKLFQDGFLVSVHVSKWGMSTNLDKEDIKYSKEEVLPAIFRLGKKMLINAERLREFERIESKARRYLDANSYDFPIADAHFVSKKKIAVVLDTLEKVKVDYFALRDTFVKNYEVYKKEMLDTYPDMAADLEPAYPPANSISGKFDFSVSLYEIQMPKELGTVDIQGLITREKAEQEVKKELEDRLSGHYRRSLEKIETFTQDAAALLRGQVVEMCRTINDRITNKKVVSKKNIQMIKDEIQHFKELNVFDDKAVERELDNLGKVIEGSINYKTDPEALNALSRAVTNVLDRATDINDLNDIPVNYFRAIKL